MRRKKALSIVRPWDDNDWSASPLSDPVSQREQLRRFEEEWERQDEERRTRIAVEKAKIDRIEKLRSMSEAELSYWIKLNEEELKRDSEETLEEQEELRKFVERIRAERLMEADARLEDAAKEANEGISAEETPVVPAPQPEPVVPPQPAEIPEQSPQTQVSSSVYQRLLRDVDGVSQNGQQ